jgi:hypothetical protein
VSSVAVSRTITVSQADVLYVTQEIIEDLRALRRACPSAVSDAQILDLSRAVGTFLINDAIETLGFSLATARDGGTVLHELRYAIRYGAPVSRSGRGGAAVKPVEQSCVLVPWVTWSHRMLSLSHAEQTQIVEQMGWSLPGTNALNLRYPPGSTRPRGEVCSGPLHVACEEFRADG